MVLIGYTGPPLGGVIAYGTSIAVEAMQLTVLLLFNATMAALAWKIAGGKLRAVRLT